MDNSKVINEFGELGEMSSLDRESRIVRFKAIWDECPEEVVSELDRIGYFTKPGSTKFHGAYEGGLYDHSERVTINLIKLTESIGLSWSNPRSPYLVGFLHDLCKCYQYHKVENKDGSIKWIYACDKPGHGSLSATIAKKLFPDLNEEEEFCIRFHMGAYDKDHWDELDKGIRKYINVLYTHTADMLSSKVDNI